MESNKLPLAALGRFQEHGPLILAVINKGQISWNVGLEIFTPIICTLSNYNMVISGLDNKEFAFQWNHKPTGEIYG